MTAYVVAPSDEPEWVLEATEWFVHAVLPEHGLHRIEPGSMRTVELTADQIAGALTEARYG